MCAVEHNSHLDVFDDLIGRKFGPDCNKGGSVGLLLCDEPVYPENVLEVAFGMVLAIERHPGQWGLSDFVFKRVFADDCTAVV